MKKYILIIFIIAFIPNHGESIYQFPKGLGIDIGFGSNELLWGLRDNEGDRSVFNLSLSSRIYYKIPVSESLNLKPFLGYIRFGGKSEEQDNGYKDQYFFDAFEFGSQIVLEEESLPLNFSLGLKVKKYFSAKSKSYGGIFDDAGTERTWIEQDVSNFFSEYSINIGAGVGTSISNFYIVMEYWVGLNDFKNKDLFATEDQAIKENHYRLFLGYQL